MPAAQKADPRWRYLRARVLVKLGQQDRRHAAARRRSRRKRISTAFSPPTGCSSRTRSARPNSPSMRRRREAASTPRPRARVRVLRAERSARSAPRMGFRPAQRWMRNNAVWPPISPAISAGTTAPCIRLTKATICICYDLRFPLARRDTDRTRCEQRRHRSGLGLRDHPRRKRLDQPTRTPAPTPGA